MARIFVYGTLKRGFHAHGLMQNAPAAFLREATTAPRFQLYDIGAFPGLVEDESLEGGVKGELFEVPEAALKDLDRYECVSRGLFRRGEVELEDGSKSLAYFFNMSLEGAHRIESGVWE